MSDEAGKHVFISYVHEDADQVDSLCAVLDAAQIPYWRDRKNLGPGDAWKAKIRAAIRDGSLVFLACFSDNSRAKDKSYMNEELSLAVEEFRQMSLGRVWLIPVRFDAGDVPEWDLGAGRVLSDFNYADLFGKDHMAQMTTLVVTITRQFGEKRTDAATALAAVEQAASADRVHLLKRLTKEMLPDPARRIELADLVSQEVQRVLTVLKDEARVTGQPNGTNEEKIVRVAEEAGALWALVEPFCASLHVASRWGDAEELAPWASGIRSFVTAAAKPAGGLSALVGLRHLPGMVSIMTAALACTSSGRWAALRSLIVDQSVPDRQGQRPTPIVEATDPYKPFPSSSDLVPNVLARAAIEEKSLEESLKDFMERREVRFHTPIAEWLHHVLRPLFADQWPDDDAYSAEFDRAEVMLGVLAQDAATMRVNMKPHTSDRRRSYWFGRSTWRSETDGNAIADLAHDLETQGTQWGPLRAGLFGGSLDRARDAVDVYQNHFNGRASRLS